MQIIALQRGLESLAEALQANGYETAYADTLHSPASVYIYQESANELHFTALSSQLDQGFPMTSSVYSGVFLINAKNKSTDEILYMIAHRCYSPLF